MTTIETIATWLVFVSAVPVFLTAVLYALRSPWWRYPIGRAFLVLTVGFSLNLTIGCLFWALGDDYPGRQVVRLITYTLTSLGGWGVLVSLVREQRARPDVDPVVESAGHAD